MFESDGDGATPFDMTIQVGLRGEPRGASQTRPGWPSAPPWGMATGLSLGLVRWCKAVVKLEQLGLLDGCRFGRVHCLMGRTQISAREMFIE